MKTNQETAHKPTELLKDLRALVTEAEAMMTDSGSEHSSATVASLRARVAAAQERFSHICKDARQKVVAGAKHTDATIRANPYQALAVAAGVGLLVGVLLGRRGR